MLRKEADRNPGFDPESVGDSGRFGCTRLEVAVPVDGVKAA